MVWWGGAVGEVGEVGAVAGTLAKFIGGLGRSGMSRPRWMQVLLRRGRRGNLLPEGVGSKAYGTPTSAEPELLASQSL